MFHKNRLYFKTDSHENFLPFEPKCSTFAGLKHSRNFGPKFHNCILTLKPELINLNFNTLKNKRYGRTVHISRV